jgi:hypothetical protein
MVTVLGMNGPDSDLRLLRFRHVSSFRVSFWYAGTRMIACKPVDWDTSEVLVAYY